MTIKDAEKALELINKLSNNCTDAEDQKLFKELKSELQNLQKPDKFDKKTYTKVLKKLIKWSLISHNIISEIIDLWTSDE